jgi:hypothetical protein
MKGYEQAYNYGSILFIILYIITFIGIWNDSPKYLQLLDDIFKIFIGLLLIYIFNPFSPQTITPFHKKIAFYAGISILLSSSLRTYFQKIPVVKTIIPKA